MSDITTYSVSGVMQSSNLTVNLNMPIILLLLYFYELQYIISWIFFHLEESVFLLMSPSERHVTFYER